MKNYGGYFDITSKESRIKELEDITKQSDFWLDKNKVQETMDEINNLKDIVHNNIELKDKISNDLELIEILELENDSKTQNEIEQDISSLKEKINELEMFTLLNSEYDKNNCILEIHAGAGGTEACDWANMLYRMYQRYLERHKFKYEVISYLEGEEVGIKSVSLKVEGLYAYGYLKCEKGVHRLVRLSPFDANNKRHTSFASVDVTPEFTEVSDIEIQDKDLKIDVYRSSGAGGQHINTTDSAVRITHLPTKILEKQAETLSGVKGESLNIEFGSQIRSYVMHPYSMVKDHRTNYETANVSKVLDGYLDEFIESVLKNNVK